MHMFASTGICPMSFRRHSAVRAVVSPPVLIALLLLSRTSATDIPLQGHTQLRLANVEAGADIVGTTDEFVQLMGSLERQLRLRSDAPVSSQRYLEFVRQQVLPWTPQDAERIRRTVEEIRPPLERLAPLWPDIIPLVKTTGREEGDAPHCRGNAIILPNRALQFETAEFRAVLIHELFHILSRQSASRRAAMFEIVGFRAVESIPLPEEWQQRRITNPDAPQVDCVMRLQHAGQALTVAPVLLTKQDAYPSAGDRSLFGELVFGLMPVELQASHWVPDAAARGGKLWQPNELPAFAEQIGRNTSYIIHPEEILADNFVHLVNATEDLPDPWIVTRLKELLQAP
jgi:hypothetical protein